MTLDICVCEHIGTHRDTYIPDYIYCNYKSNFLLWVPFKKV